MSIPEYSDIVEKALNTISIVIGALFTAWVSCSRFLRNKKMRRLNLIKSLEDKNDSTAIQELTSEFKSNEKFFLMTGIRAEAKQRDLLLQMYKIVSPIYEWKHIRLALPHLTYKNKKVNVRTTWIDEISLQFANLLCLVLTSLTIYAIILVGCIIPDAVNSATLGSVFILAITAPIPLLPSRSVRIAKFLRKVIQDYETDSITKGHTSE